MPKTAKRNWKGSTDPRRRSPVKLPASTASGRGITAAVLAAGLISILSLFPTTATAYEPSFEELLSKREQIERFCGLLDHQRRFAICETYEKNRSKLPQTNSELELLRRAQNRTID